MTPEKIALKNYDTRKNSTEKFEAPKKIAPKIECEIF